MNPILLAILNTVLPEAIARVKELYAKENPNAPALTDPQIHAEMLTYVASTLAKDNTFLSEGG